MKTLRNCIFLSLLLFFIQKLFCNSTLPYPEIKDLRSDDVFFNQYSVAVARARKAIASLDQNADLSPEFYTYVVKANETLISIAARCCIPYDAIATLNRIASVEQDLEGSRIILPSLPALYVYRKPNSAIERLVFSYVDQMVSDFKGFDISIFTGMQTSQEVYCLPNALFNGTIRAFFFLPYYSFPLESKRITSPFGMRKDPFTGKDAHHTGIDIGARYGSPVYAITSGIVAYVGYDRVLGNHVVLKHNDGRESIYGHLSKATVSKNAKIKKGSKLGEVGSTGRSTGNHLHLEIRESSIPIDPITFFKDEVLKY